MSLGQNFRQGIEALRLLLKRRRTRFPVAPVIGIASTSHLHNKRVDPGGLGVRDEFLNRRGRGQRGPNDPERTDLRWRPRLLHCGPRRAGEQLEATRQQQESDDRLLDLQAGAVCHGHAFGLDDSTHLSDFAGTWGQVPPPIGGPAEDREYRYPVRYCRSWIVATSGLPADGHLSTV